MSRVYVTSLDAVAHILRVGEPMYARFKGLSRARTRTHDLQCLQHDHQVRTPVGRWCLLCGRFSQGRLVHSVQRLDRTGHLSR